jgi:hypothetical protein
MIGGRGRHGGAGDARRLRRELDPAFGVDLGVATRGICEMTNLETYREKALQCTRAADEVRDPAQRVELLGLASIYMALADYVDAQHEQSPAPRGAKDQGTRRTVK